MKRLALLPLALLAFLMFSGSPAIAQKPIPGIKQTAAWKSLARYVDFLEARRNQPSPQSRHQAYRTDLASRRGTANTKVLALYSQKLTRLAKQDDRWERQQIRKIRQDQKRTVQGLQATLDNRIDALRTKQAAAVSRVTDRFAPKINPLVDKRDRLQRRLAKTTNPDKRATLTRQINRIQSQINDLASDRQAEVDNVNSRYASRIQSVTDLFNSRIRQARASAQRQIAQTHNAWRQTFRVQVQAAKTRRDTQKELVGALATRGSGYIDQMPVS